MVPIACVHTMRHKRIRAHEGVISVSGLFFNFGIKGIVSKETVVLRWWGRGVFQEKI